MEKHRDLGYIYRLTQMSLPELEELKKQEKDKKKLECITAVISDRISTEQIRRK